MPAYFYHLKFELYATPDPNAGAEAATRTCSQAGFWLPPSEASIFDDLPAHPQKTRNSTFLFNRSHSYQAESRTSQAGPAPLAISPATPNVIDCGAPRTPEQEQSRKTYEVVSERQWRQRTRSLPPAPSKLGLQPQTASADWRFGRVTIETIDLNWDMSRDAEKTGATAAPSLGPSYGGAGTANKAECLLLKSKNTEVGWGVVHFYREGDETIPPTEVEPEFADEEDGEQDDAAFTTVCIPAVPAYMSAGDFLGFVGERWREDISHCRLVMTSKMNRYLALLKFRSGQRAKLWRQEFDGRVFNTMEVCLTSDIVALLGKLLISTATNLSRGVRQGDHVRNARPDARIRDRQSQLVSTSVQQHEAFSTSDAEPGGTTNLSCLSRENG